MPNAGEEAGLVLPPPSVAVAVMLWAPSLKVLAVIVQLPKLSAVVVPIFPLTLLVRVTVLLASAVPVKVGVVLLVMLSVLELPESVAAVMSGVEGAVGAPVSITMSLLSARDCPPGIVRVTLFPVPSCRVAPPANTRGELEFKSALFSPVPTV